MKIYVSILVIFLITLSFKQTEAQSGWMADLRVETEFYFTDQNGKEIDIEMVVDLYYNENIVQVPQNAIIKYYRYKPLADDPQWEFRDSLIGTNEFGTHTTLYPEQNDDEKILDFYCNITIPDDNITFNSDTIRVPWSKIEPGQKNSSGYSFGSVDYWYKDSFRNNNGLSDIYSPGTDLFVLNTDTSVNNLEKFNNWKNYLNTTEYLNFIKKDVNEDDILENPMTSHFKPTKNATVRAYIDNYYLDIVKFKDPWLRDYNEQPYGVRNQGLLAQPEQIANTSNNLSVNGNHQGVFLYQNSSFDPNIPFYTINIPSSITVEGTTHKINLLGWDLTNAQLENNNQLETGVVFTNNNASVTANLKGSLLSNNIVAYKSGSQNKIVKTQNGTMHTVYESMGKVWYEYSKDNGSTWILGNDNQPLNSGSDAKQPSIDFIGDVVLIAYGENYSVEVESFSPNYDGDYIHRDTQEIEDFIVAENDLHPVISCDWNTSISGRFIIVYKTSTKLRCRIGGVDTPTGNLYTLSNIYNVPNTNSNSKNPTITNRKNSDVYHHFAWEQDENTYNYEIRYYRLKINSNNTLSFYNYAVASSGSGFPQNVKPSILVSNYNTALVLWVGVSWNGHPYDRVVHRSRYNSGNWSSTFTQLGSYVEMVSSNTSDTHNKIIYSWVEDSGTPTNKFRATDVNGTQTLNTNGNYVQVSNGSSLSNIYTMAFRKESSPYYFKLSNSMGSYAKSNDNKYVGREGIVRNQEVEYTCTLSDVDVDGKRIDFVEIDEMAPAKSVEKLYSDLETIPFEVNDLSDFTFNLSYGITNTEKAEKVLSEKHSVKYIVELVDAENGKVLNELDEIVFDENNVEQGGEKSYKVDTKGLGKRSLKLRLRVKTDLKVTTTTATIESEENVLAKQGVKNIENVTAERIPVTDYALFQNYPNPFNPTTTISYQIPRDGKVTIKVYDSIGKEVATLVNEEKQRGRYSVTFDANNLPAGRNGLTSGIYFYSLTSGKYKETKKLILLK